MPKTVVRTGNHLVYSYQGIALISKNAAKVMFFLASFIFIRLYKTNHPDIDYFYIRVSCVYDTGLFYSNDSIRLFFLFSTCPSFFTKIRFFIFKELLPVIFFTACIIVSTFLTAWLLFFAVSRS